MVLVCAASCLVVSFVYADKSLSGFTAVRVVGFFDFFLPFFHVSISVSLSLTVLGKYNVRRDASPLDRHFLFCRSDCGTRQVGRFEWNGGSRLEPRGGVLDICEIDETLVSWFAFLGGSDADSPMGGDKSMQARWGWCGLSGAP